VIGEKRYGRIALLVHGSFMMWLM